MVADGYYFCDEERNAAYYESMRGCGLGNFPFFHVLYAFGILAALFIYGLYQEHKSQPNRGG